MPRPSLLIGADPEFIITEPNGRQIYATTYFESMRGFSTRGGNVGCNGASNTGEMRPKPVGEPSKMLDNIEDCVRLIAQKVPHTKKVFAGGIVADRSIGGHIHFSKYTDNADFYKFVMNYLSIIGVCMMYEVGKQRYGQGSGYGRFGFGSDVRTFSRVEVHSGFEFRPLSSWLYNRDLTEILISISYCLLYVFDDITEKRLPTNNLVTRSELNELNQFFPYPRQLYSSISKNRVEKLLDLVWEYEDLRIYLPLISNSVDLIDNRPLADKDIREVWLGANWVSEVASIPVLIDNIHYSADEILPEIRTELDRIIQREQLRCGENSLYVYGIAETREMGIYLNQPLKDALGAGVETLNEIPIKIHQPSSVGGSATFCLGIHKTTRNTLAREVIAIIIKNVYIALNQTTRIQTPEPAPSPRTEPTTTPTPAQITRTPLMRFYIGANEYYGVLENGSITYRGNRFIFTIQEFTPDQSLKVKVIKDGDYRHVIVEYNLVSHAIIGDSLNRVRNNRAIKALQAYIRQQLGRSRVVGSRFRRRITRVSTTPPTPAPSPTPPPTPEPETTQRVYVMPLIRYKIDNSTYPATFIQGNFTYRGSQYNIAIRDRVENRLTFNVRKGTNIYPVTYRIDLEAWAGGSLPNRIVQGYIRQLSIEQWHRQAEREAERIAGVGRPARRGRGRGRARVPVVTITLGNVTEWSGTIPEIRYSGLSGFTSARARAGQMSTWGFKVWHLYENGEHNPPTKVKFEVTDIINPNVTFASIMYDIATGYWTPFENERNFGQAKELVLRYLTQLIEKDVREGRQVRII